MSDLTVLAQGPIGAEAVEVEWVAESPTISAEAQATIDRRWDFYMADARAKGKSLFNGAITRLIRAERGPGGGAGERGLRLVLGPADYKTFVVTVMRDREWFLRNAPEVMAFALGNSVLLTRGDRALLGVRSEGTSAYAGRAHVIGGVLEQLGTAELPASVAGVLTHLRREMQEEANLRDGDVVGEPMLLALARDSFLAQPEMIWQWEVAVELEEVVRRLDAHEHHGAVLVEKGGVAGGTWELMTPVAREAWRLWRERR
ncbi:MAG TPA: hypothetical protein VM008_18455 [Phycisphaerae bacterium]|nr:hypothetical protein [Phycisphaerae bacterium]